ncbi:TPR repeat, SEL1 subfamily [alpha proteobacterium U9-1i]|nr:TPR repeat, SEL1 subfamily [alpha proteobacterium U9-1i]
MSGAQNWSVKGIDPKVREAVREAAEREGLSLGEYLSQALQKQTHAAPSAAQTRLRASRVGAPSVVEDEEEDWRITGPTQMTRAPDAQRLTQRIEAIERRTQLAVTGLDRAVSTIDRSVLGLAARVEDAETVSRESADRIAEALDHFRVAGDTLGGRIEQEIEASREALDHAVSELSESKSELLSAKERLEAQASAAEEVARRAEAAANFLATELENRDAAIGHKLGALEDAARQTLAEARNAAEEAARQASIASNDAVTELRRLQESLSDRLSETEQSTRRAVETAIQQTRAETHEVRETLSDINARIAAASELVGDHAELISRIERAEAGARESTAGLRQAAGAAIADLRNAQLSLAARLKQVEETSGKGGALDLHELRQTQTDITERLATLEVKTRENPMENALAKFEKRIDDIAAKVEAAPKVEIEVKTLDDAMQRLAQRLAETESSANTAIRTLEETVSSLSARVENGAPQETEALRSMLEQRLDTMANDLAGQVHAALENVQGEGLEEALADVNRRLAAAERRQAQTIEAISIEIKRMSESVDKRLRSVEARNDDAAASAVREELSRMGQTLEHRFDEIERREAAAFDRMGLEVGRLSERLEERVGAVEVRSAQAIEQVGEQVARMAERFNQRHEILARDLGERMIDSEERSGARVSEAISSIMQRLNEVEVNSADAIAPVQKAVSSVASKLEQFNSAQPVRHEPVGEDVVPTPSRRFSDFDAFGDVVEEEDDYVSPMDAAQPVRAGPIAPPPHAHDDDDIYFADDLELTSETNDDVLLDIDAPVTNTAPPPASGDVFAAPEDDLTFEDEFVASDETSIPPPPADDDPFWSPEAETGALAPLDIDDDSTAIPFGEPPVQTTAEADAQIAADAEASLAPALFDDEPAAAPSKNDYLANARKAAQAQSQPKAKTPAEMAATPTYSLRGSSRIVLWGAASAIALLIAGGAWYVNSQRQEAPEPAPEPTSPPVARTSETPAFDPNQPFGTPVEGAEAGGAEAAVVEEPATAGPIAATSAPVQQQAVVAGPLAPRNVSLEQAAQSGDMVAQYELGLQRIAAGRGADGVPLLRRAADRGLAMAQYRLAKLYERGEGVPADLALARQWTERAAAAGNRRAMHDLGVYFARGEGAALDEAAAFRWFRQAAELGVADSQYNLGVLYQQGRGVNASASEAMFWFLVAARQGDEDAAARAATLEPTLQPIQVEQARARAASFRPRAASGIANGEFGPRAWNARQGT